LDVAARVDLNDAALVRLDGVDVVVIGPRSRIDVIHHATRSSDPKGARFPSPYPESGPSRAPADGHRSAPSTSKSNVFESTGRRRPPANPSMNPMTLARPLGRLRWMMSSSGGHKVWANSQTES